MNARTHLPPRRRHFLEALVFHHDPKKRHELVPAGKRKADVYLGYGVDESKRIREVFCTADKTGSDRQAIFVDGCILLSIAMQTGTDAQALAISLGENRDEGEPDGPPSSILGAVARRAAMWDAALAAGKEFTDLEEQQADSEETNAC